jgi:general stress protein YciG
LRINLKGGVAKGLEFWEEASREEEEIGNRGGRNLKPGGRAVVADADDAETEFVKELFRGFDLLQNFWSDFSAVGNAGGQARGSDFFGDGKSGS